MTQYTAINTDLYELTMAAGYFQQHHNQPASFDLFVRKLPDHRNYLVAAGLEQALDYIVNLRFTDEEIQYLRSLDTFRHINDDFFDYLREFRFTGDVYAVAEGTVVFPDESILQVHAPIVEAQIMETYLISTIQHQTMIASKAARVVQASKYGEKERAVLEFGSRRAHGPEAGVMVGRAGFIGGCKGTSNTLAGFRFGIPVSGTMAHSWVMSFESEKEAFQQFHQAFGDQSIYLVDTYNSLEGTINAAEASDEFRGIRLDSGDLVELSKEARKLLDDRGHKNVQIFASGDLDEYRIKEILEKGGQIDAFGVGTQLSTSADAPNLNMVYKLSEYDQAEKTKYKIKLSKKKQTLPGLKQVYRFFDEHGKMKEDLITFIEEDDDQNGHPLVSKYMENGKLVKALPSIQTIQHLAKKERSQLPDDLKSLRNEVTYPVSTSEEMQTLTNELAKKLRRMQANE